MLLVKKKDAKSEAKKSTGLSSLVEDALGLESREREEFVVNKQAYVSVVGRMSHATMQSMPGYIEGAEMRDIVVSTTKTILGKSTDVTVLGIFKLYAIYDKDTVDKNNKKVQGKLKRYVMPEDGVQIRDKAQAMGCQFDNFNTELPNGDWLRPIHWIYLYLHDAPEIDNAIVSLSSGNNKIATAVSKAIQQSGAAHSAELRFTLSSAVAHNETSEWLVLTFEPQKQRNFIIENGDVIQVKGGFSTEEIEEVLRRSNEQRKAYTSCLLVGSYKATELFGAAPQKALTKQASKYADEGDDDEENLRF